MKINYTNRLARDDCTIRSRCTGGPFRSVSRMENEAVLDRMQARWRSARGILGQRRETVEHPFGTNTAPKACMEQRWLASPGFEFSRGLDGLANRAHRLRKVVGVAARERLLARLAVAECCGEHHCVTLR